MINKVHPLISSITKSLENEGFDSEKSEFSFKLGIMKERGFEVFDFYDCHMDLRYGEPSEKDVGYDNIMWYGNRLEYGENSDFPCIRVRYETKDGEKTRFFVPRKDCF